MAQRWGAFGEARPRAAAALLGLAVLTRAPPAQAQPTSNDYAVDLYQGPILASARTLSMGGAYAGYAEGIGGYTNNAASPAMRHQSSLSWWDFDIDGGLSFPLQLFENDDFDNSGDTDADYSNFIYLAGGLQLQAGPFGAGAFGDLQRYTLRFAPDADATVVTVGRYHLLGAWGFFGHQLMVGAGARALTLGISAPDTELTIFGISPQVGVVVRPDWTPFRFGATYRHAVKSQVSIGSGQSETDGVVSAGNLVIPDRVQLPWEIEVGTAIQVGARPLNPAWINPDDHEQELRDRFERRRRRRLVVIRRRLLALPPGDTRESTRERLLAEEAQRQELEANEMERDLERLRDERRAIAQGWPRDALLLTADLLVTGPVKNAINLQSFLGQGQGQNPPAECTVVASGGSVVFSPRLGLEAEPVPRYMHARFGTYFEPNRYRLTPDRCNDRVGRQHFTFGLDVKLVTTTWWGLVPEVTYKLQGYGDVAPRYQSFGLGFGVWH
ncbi:MAG: hypothetical protein KC731_38940 [Myxococcales bacterium]|nr:hypothetical protein [Myxococcales bacterium]